MKFAFILMIVGCVSVFGGRLVSAQVIAGGGGPSMSQVYRDTARAERAAAAQYRAKGCQQAATCAEQNAAYYDCLAAQLGPNGPRNCTAPTCTRDCAAASGGSSNTSGGSNPSANTGQTTAQQQQAQVQQAIEQMQRDIQRVQNARDRQEQVDEQIREEMDNKFKLKPKNMTPDGKDVGGLLDGDAKGIGSTGDLSDRERRFGDASGRPIENLSDPELTDRMKAAVNDDSNYREFGEESNKPSTGTTADGKPLSEMSDAELADLYSPESGAKPDGWGNPTDITPEMYKDAPPITEIEFFKDGKVVVKEYDQRVYSHIEFPSSNPDRDLRSVTVTGGSQSAPVQQTPTDTGQVPVNNNSAQTQKLGPDVKILPDTFCGLPDCTVPLKNYNSQKALFDTDKADNKPGETTNTDSYWKQAKDWARDKYEKTRDATKKWINDKKEALTPQWVRSATVKYNELKDKLNRVGNAFDPDEWFPRR